MKSVWVWFFLSCKRYLRKASFLLILLILPAVTFFVRGLEEKEGQEVRIALCTEGAGRWEREFLKSLTGETLGAQSPDDRRLFRFYECENEEQVKDQVASRKAECGYVFPGDLKRRLDEGDYKRCIRVYSAPSTVLADLSTEVVFAALMKLYDREIFLDYVTESKVLETEDGAKRLAGELYDKWLTNGSTFRFEYRYDNGGQKGKDKESGQGAVSVFPVRGIAAVYLMLAGMYSAVMLGYDEKKGLFAPLSPKKRLACRMAVLASPVFLAALSALGALKTGGCFQGMALECRAMGRYGAAVCVFSYGLKAVFRKPEVIGCLIPFVLVGSLVFSPVFVDIRQFFPEWGWMEKAFLASYYLRGF